MLTHLLHAYIEKEKKTQFDALYLCVYYNSGIYAHSKDAHTYVKYVHNMSLWLVSMPISILDKINRKKEISDILPNFKLK